MYLFIRIKAWGALAAIALLMAWQMAGAAQPCPPRWLPAFGGEDGGTNGTIQAMLTFDYGTTKGLIVAGGFSEAGGMPASNIAQWDGAAWSPLGSGLSGVVRALAVYDDGGGTALYAAGSFLQAGGEPASRIAKWDGDQWSALGVGLNNTVYALSVFDDGDGSMLYVGGAFSTAAGGVADHIAVWDGSAWTNIGGETNGIVSSLGVFDDGNGPALHAGGSFTTAGDVAASGIAKWDGAAWSPLGAGVAGNVFTMLTFDDGSGEALYVGGRFNQAGGASAARIAKWDGAAWSPLGTGLPTTVGVESLAVYDDGMGGGPTLFAGGGFSSGGDVQKFGIARWQDGRWWALHSGTGGTVRALAVYDDGTHDWPALVAGGGFSQAGGHPVNNIAKWQGCNEPPQCDPAWTALPSPLNGRVSGMKVFGGDLYVAGWFTMAGDLEVNRIARWDGTQWSALGSGLNATASAIEVFDDGTGPALYVGGGFTEAGGVAANRIAKWDGAQWSALGSGVSPGGTPGVFSLAVFDDGEGGGPALHIGGSFSAVGGVDAENIARWDGQQWSAVGAGLAIWVNALKVHDDGTGAALYAGGNFSVPLVGVAKWDGVQWSQLGAGLGISVFALEVFDDGDGAALYAGGSFRTAVGGVPGTSRLAKWDGENWSGLETGMDSNVHSLTVFDDGTGGGPALHVGGQFVSAGWVEASRIAKWDGEFWWRLRDGIAANVNPSPAFLVNTMTVYDDGQGNGPALYAGGNFEVVDGQEIAYLAKWGCGAVSRNSARGYWLLIAE